MIGDGAAHANGEASSSSSSSSSSSVDDTPQAVLGGFANVDEGQPPPRRLLSATRVGAAWLREASSTQYAAQSLVAWTGEGGAIRALLVVSVGSVVLVALTVLLIFVFFLVAATTSAILFSVLMSMAAVGGFLAVLLAFLALMYVGVMSVAVFVISATTVATVVAITIATGWVAFIWVLWFSAKKFMDLAKCY